MLPLNLAALVRAEQAVQQGRFVDVPDLEAYLSKLGEKAEILSDSIGGRCRGFVAFYCNDHSTRRAYITLVLVDPQDRGLGIGRSLVSGVLQLARARGFTSCALEVAPSSAAAHALYQSLGFTTVETHDGKDLMEIAL